MMKLQARPSTTRSVLRQPASRRAVVVPKAGLFGFGKSKAEVEAEREEEWRAQQDLIAKRKSGAFIREADDRRAAVRKELRAKKEERASERESLARGVIPDTLKNWKPYDDESEANSRSGVVIPLLPFGMPKYDAGERFDLRNPFSDTGYVDPDEMTAMDSLRRFGKKVFDFSLGTDGSIERDAKKQVMVPTNIGKKPWVPPTPPAPKDKKK